MRGFFMSPPMSSSLFKRLQTPWLRRFVLACFVLAIGSAIASPLVKPQSMELLCSASGAMKLLVKSSDDDSVESTHTMQCALCMPISTPPQSPQPAFFRSDLAYAHERIPAAILAALTLPPLPARGPPSAS
jgi:hypothetical protein